MFGIPTSQIVPRNWLEAHDFFEARRFKNNDYRNLPCRNTSVYHRGYRDGEPVYAIQLYATDIITYYPDDTVELDAYDSATTNSRRDDAGAPRIRSATAMGMGMTKAQSDRMEYDKRWDVWDKRFPYGVPAVDMKLDAQGHVTHLDRRPVEEFREHVMVPIPEAQKARRKVLRRTRNYLRDWCHAVAEMNPDEGGYWEFDEMDMESWLAAIDKGEYATEADAVAAFVDNHWCGGCPMLNSPDKALEAQLKVFAPAADKRDRSMWKAVPVHPSQLGEYLA